jgi:lysyl-tRNA synthetase class 2
MPPCSGVALGFDRMVMIATGARHIDEVVAFPTERA